MIALDDTNTIISLNDTCNNVINDNELEKFKEEYYKDFEEFEKMQRMNLNEQLKLFINELIDLYFPYIENIPDAAIAKIRERFIIKNKFYPGELGMIIIDALHIKKSINWQLYFYYKGVYHPNGEGMIKEIVNRFIGKENYSPQKEAGTLSYILSYIKAEEFFITDRFINVKNGLLEWRSGTLFKHDPDLFIISQLPVEYIPNKIPIQFNRYIESTFPEDQELQLLIQEIMAYCLIPTVKLQKAFLLTGSGANGKSIFIETLQALLGLENVSNVSLQDLSDNRFAASRLVGKLANLFADLSNKALNDSEIFKCLVTGDSISVEHKFKDSFNYKNYARLVFSANELPNSRDKTFAFYRRWIIVPFEQKFEGSNADKNLINKLITPDELSGILNQCIVLLNGLMGRGEFIQPEAIRRTLEIYERQNDSVKSFLYECIVMDDSKYIQKSLLYQVYKKWCDESGYKFVCERNFKESFIKVFPDIKECRLDVSKIRPTISPRGKWCWIGIYFSDAIN